MRSWRQASHAFGILGSLATSGCGVAGPPPQSYVLGDAVKPSAGDAFLPIGPTVLVRPVRVPDYLDTMDILWRRDDGRIIASQSGRWGERLSRGIGDAVAGDLQQMLPHTVVTTSGSQQSPQLQIMIDIQTLDLPSHGPCVLAGRWSIWPGEGGRMLHGEEVLLTTPVNGTADTDAVAAINRQVNQLILRIAPVLAADLTHPQVATP